jgi:radical SAM protein with 4Fe4S-binding SPASM domain
MLLNVHTLPATVAMVKELGGAGMTVGDLLEYPTAAGQSVTRDLEYARPFYEEAKRLAETLDVNFVPFPSLAEEMESAPYDPEKPLPAPRREYATPVILWETKSPGARPVPIPQLASLLPVAGVVECAGDIPTAAPPVEAQSPAIREESETSAAPPVPVGPQRPGMMRVKDCTDPWNFAFVQADGDIRPCCWIDDTMGNVNTESFESIWNSQKYQDLRKSVASANPRSECWGCQARGWKWVPEPLAAAVFAVE